MSPESPADTWGGVVDRVAARIADGQPAEAVVAEVLASMARPPLRARLAGVTSRGVPKDGIAGPDRVRAWDETLAAWRAMLATLDAAVRDAR